MQIAWAHCCCSGYLERRLRIITNARGMMMRQHSTKKLPHTMTAMMPPRLMCEWSARQGGQSALTLGHCAWATRHRSGNSRMQKAAR